ncbi:unnamed protein product [Polarella glacialis]|uniref:Uncharacterized protein n=1 Tax=Polarella glacialis TaxID=89957 RepID=A0A813DVV0_POLGL|nr:unnamed protein product [Polarella glacialis]
MLSTPHGSSDDLLEVLPQEGVTEAEELCGPMSFGGGSSSSGPGSKGDSEGKTWKQWAGRNEDGSSEEYRFGDLTKGFVASVQAKSGGFVSTMQAGICDLKHQMADTALSLREGHEQRAVDFVRTLAREDVEVKEMADAAFAASAASTSAERFWCSICKDAHSDHKQEYDGPLEPPKGLIGSLEARVLGMEGIRLDAKEASQPVCLFVLEGHRTGALHPPSSSEAGSKAFLSMARFNVSEVAGSDLGVFVFDRCATSFRLGDEDKAFCGGCFVPLAAIIQRSACWSALYSGLLGTSFEVELTLNLLPLRVVRAKSKLQPACTSGTKNPMMQLGQVRVGLKLSLRQSPLELYFVDQDTTSFQASAEAMGASAGHVSNPLSVLNAAANAAGRTGNALKMESWAAALDELRESCSPVWVGCWSVGTLGAPLWCWPLLVAPFLWLFAWKVKMVDSRFIKDERHNLYVNEDGDPAPKDLMREAVKVQLSIMQLTDSVNRLASQLEKVKFLVAADDRCLSSIIAVLSLAASLALAMALWISVYICNSGFWRYLLWLPGTAVLLPKSLRGPLYKALAEAEFRRRQLLGDDMERRLAGFWHRVPDGKEASHLQLFKQELGEVSQARARFLRRLGSDCPGNVSDSEDFGSFAGVVEGRSSKLVAVVKAFTDLVRNEIQQSSRGIRQIDKDFKIWETDLSRLGNEMGRGLPGVQSELSRDVYLAEHLSNQFAASDLLRTVVIFGVIYLAVGSFIKYQTNGASGINMIPHVGFWVEYPALVVDGIAYSKMLLDGAMGKSTSASSSYDTGLCLDGGIRGASLGRGGGAGAFEAL